MKAQESLDLMINLSKTTGPHLVSPPAKKVRKNLWVKTSLSLIQTLMAEAGLQIFYASNVHSSSFLAAWLFMLLWWLIQAMTLVLSDWTFTRSPRKLKHPVQKEKWNHSELQNVYKKFGFLFWISSLNSQQSENFPPTDLHLSWESPISLEETTSPMPDQKSTKTGRGRLRYTHVWNCPETTFICPMQTGCWDAVF